MPEPVDLITIKLLELMETSVEEWQSLDNFQ